MLSEASNVVNLRVVQPHGRQPCPELQWISKLLVKESVEPIPRPAHLLPLKLIL